MTVHEVTGRMELAGRQIVMLEEDRDRIKAVISAQDEVLNAKIREFSSKTTAPARIRSCSLFSRTRALTIAHTHTRTHARTHFHSFIHSLPFTPPHDAVGESNNVRDDTNHKLALQVAENKRMQAQLTKANEDIARLTRLAENLAVRVQILEAHTGVSSF